MKSQRGRSSLDIEHIQKSAALTKKQKPTAPWPVCSGPKAVLTTDNPPETKLSFTEAAREANDEQKDQ